MTGVEQALNLYLNGQLYRRADALIADAALRSEAGPSSAPGRLALVHAMHEAVRAVDKVFHAAGTNAIYTRLPLQRAFRDVHVAVQLAAALPGYFESAGRALFGLRPGDPGW